MACNALPMKDDCSHKLLAEPMFESICAAMEEAENAWNAVADFEAAVSDRFAKIKKHGRTKTAPVTKKEKAASAATSLLHTVDPSVVCDGLGIVNDVASAGFIAMMEELKERSASGTETGREIRHREKHLYGRGHPGFFAANPSSVTNI